jgi:hypothetical protein
MKANRIATWLAAVFVLSYLLAPIFAGMLDAGHDLRGPRIYSESYHSLLFRIGYHIVRFSEPRYPYRNRVRKWFY